MDIIPSSGAKSMPTIASLWQLFIKVLNKDLRSILILSLYPYLWALGFGAIAGIIMFSLFASGNKPIMALGMFVAATCAVLGFLALIYYSVLAKLAMLKLIDDILNDKAEKFVLKDSLRNIQPLFWPSMLMGLLFLLAVLGGLILFVIPGLALMLYFSFSTLVLLFERRSASDSLRRSFELVRGDWWRLLWFWFKLVLIMMPIWVLLGYLGDEKATPYPSLLILANFVSIFISFFFNIFASVAMIVVYKNLKGLKPEKSNV